MSGESDFRREWAFSWSLSADKCFRRCQLAWFRRYPGSWQGWDSYAEREIRQNYLHKQLLSCDAWLERLFRNAVSRTLRDFKEGKCQFTGAAVRDNSLRLMRRDWQTALRKDWPNEPKALFFREWLDGLPPDADAVYSRTRKRLLSAIANFADSPLFRRIAALPPNHIAPVDAPRSFYLAGEQVWIAPDLAWRQDDCRHLLFLSVSSVRDYPGWEIRAAIGRLYLREQIGASGLKPVVNSFFAGEGEDGENFTEFFDPEQIPLFITNSADRMRQVIRQQDAATPTDPDSCTVCEFRRICRTTFG